MVLVKCYLVFIRKDIIADELFIPLVCVFKEVIIQANIIFYKKEEKLINKKKKAMPFCQTVEHFFKEGTL